MLLFLALAAETPDLSWLSGDWCTAPKAEAVTCDHWAPSDKGVMRGRNTTRKGGKIVLNETMTIRFDASGAVFHAEPANQPPGDFPMVRYDRAIRSVTFEEAGHDYPQRVRYWRERDVLLAEISMLDGSKAVRWTFHRTLE